MDRDFSKYFAPDIVYNYPDSNLIKLSVVELTSYRAKIAHDLSNLVELHFREQLPLAFYANRLDVSGSTLNRITISYFGATVRQLQERKLLVEVEQMLINSRCSMKEIAYSLGFSEPAYFTRWFKKLKDVCPQDFRLANVSTIRNLWLEEHSL